MKEIFLVVFLIFTKDAAFVYKLNPVATGFQTFSERISAYEVMYTATPYSKPNFQHKQPE
jgi:hypothetical protein